MINTTNLHIYWDTLRMKINIKFGDNYVYSKLNIKSIAYITVTKTHCNKESTLAIFNLMSNRTVSLRQTDFFRKLHSDYSTKLDDLAKSIRFLMSIGTPMGEIIEIMKCDE